MKENFKIINLLNVRKAVNSENYVYLKRFYLTTKFLFPPVTTIQNTILKSVFTREYWIIF